ncbi:MAG: peptidylprolyl isomerase [Planctomycetaceae bacterium]
MRSLLLPGVAGLLCALAAGPVAGGETSLPEDVAAAHPEGKWTIRKADLYRYLVRYYGKSRQAGPLFEEHLEQRFVEAQARTRGAVVTEAEVERWIEDLARQVLQASGGKATLDDYCKEHEMTRAQLKRRSRTAILRERVARDEACKRDATRDKKAKLEESEVTAILNLLYQAAPKTLEGPALPEGLVAVVDGVQVTEYEYGRVLSLGLQRTEVASALNGLILSREVALLLGNEEAPPAEAIAEQRAWFLEMERNRLKRTVADPDLVTDDVVRQVVESRGLTLDLVFSNPAFLAEARARAHFRGVLDDAQLQAHFEAHKGKYGERLRIAQIFIQARAQVQVKQAGKPMRTLERGKALADALFIRVTSGEDFGALAKANSDDNDVIRLNRGEVPQWVTAETAGYEETYEVASKLKLQEISKPFFVRRGGFVIVRLLARDPAPSFDSLRPRIRSEAGDESYYAWRHAALNVARRSVSLLEE